MGGWMANAISGVGSWVRMGGLAVSGGILLLTAMTSSLRQGNERAK
jgi:hypothetical protein